MRSYLRRKREEYAQERGPSFEDVQVHPPGSPPQAGYVRQQALPHINWNQFGPKGVEHNWTDLPTRPREQLGT